MSDTESIDLNEEPKQTDSIIKQQEKEQRDILAELEIPALVEIKSTKSILDELNESKNIFKNELDETVNHSIEILDSIKQENFSRDPDFLEPQINEAKQKLDELSKNLWVKLELTDYENPEDYYLMIKTAKAILRRDLDILIKKAMVFECQNMNEEIKELHDNKFIIQDKLFAL